MPTPRLELYVFGTAPSAAETVRAVERLRAESLGGDGELAVFDLSRAPAAAREARVHLAPTLVLRAASGERRCFGDLTDPRAVAAALGLEAAGA
jgi:hypothetical protein